MIFSELRSYCALSRVSPKVVSESAAMAISSFLRTATRVVMGSLSGAAGGATREVGNYTFAVTDPSKRLGAGSIAHGGRRSGRHAAIAHDQNCVTDEGNHVPSGTGWSRKCHAASSTGSAS